MTQVRLTRLIDQPAIEWLMTDRKPRRVAGVVLNPQTVLDVVRVEADGVGVLARAKNGVEVSLHPDDFSFDLQRPPFQISDSRSQISLTPSDGSARHQWGEPVQGGTGSPTENDPMATATKTKRTSKKPAHNGPREQPRRVPSDDIFAASLSGESVGAMSNLGDPEQIPPAGLGPDLSKVVQGAVAEIGHEVSKRNGAKGAAPKLADILNSLPISHVRCHQLADHPDNRDTDLAHVADLQVKIAADGQLQPVIVRAHGGAGKYQILSGKHRWLAIQANEGENAPILQKIVPNCDDALALRILAIENAGRKDLTAIDKAKMIKKLRAAGDTWEAAGSIYNLTPAAAQNLVAVLDAPEVWQKRLARPDVPKGKDSEALTVTQAALREIAKFAHVPALLKAIDICYTKGTWPAGRDDQLEEILAAVEKHVRDPKREYYLDSRGSQYFGWKKCLFKIEAHRDELGLTELPLGDKGQMITVAINTSAYDKLQLEAAQKKSKSKHADAADRDEKKPPSASEKKAIVKEQGERLEKRIRNWRYEWLKHLIAGKLSAENMAWSDVIQRLAVWMIFPGNIWTNAGAVEIFDAILNETFDVVPSGACDECEWHSLGKIDEDSQYELHVDLINALLMLEDKNPDWPLWPREVIEDLAGMVEIDLPGEWQKLQSFSSPSEEIQDRFASFFQLHQCDQLDTLGDELGVFVKEAKTKATKLKLLTGTDRILKMPKSIEPLAKPKPTAAAKKPAKKAKAK